MTESSDESYEKNFLPCKEPGDGPYDEEEEQGPDYAVEDVGCRHGVGRVSLRSTLFG